MKLSQALKYALSEMKPSNLEKRFCASLNSLTESIRGELPIKPISNPEPDWNKRGSGRTRWMCIEAINEMVKGAPGIVIIGHDHRFSRYYLRSLFIDIMLEHKLESELLYGRGGCLEYRGSRVTFISAKTYIAEPVRYLGRNREHVYVDHHADSVTSISSQLDKSFAMLPPPSLTRYVKGLNFE